MPSRHTIQAKPYIPPYVHLVLSELEPFGGVWLDHEVMKKLELSPSALLAKRNNHALLFFEYDQKWLYPVFQFDQNRGDVKETILAILTHLNPNLPDPVKVGFFLSDITMNDNKTYCPAAILSDQKAETLAGDNMICMVRHAQRLSERFERHI